MRAVTAANRFGVDYEALAGVLRGESRSAVVRAGGVTDFHTHVNGAGAGPIWARAAAMFGVCRVFTQVRLGDAWVVREAMRGCGGPSLEFIAFPDFRIQNRAWAFTEGYLADIPVFRREFGARFIKLWNGPRLRDMFEGDSGKDVIEFDSPWRVRHVELAQSLGMGVMVHVADPDTWFATKYADAGKYGRKADHYRGLRVMMDRFAGPWIAAHMGGWPEDLGFLDGLLGAHANLYLDTSATKWVVRALGGHEPERVREFFAKWKGRILFGSDIVTTDEHLQPVKPENKHPMADLAESSESAFELYASRYAALMLMLESTYDGESLIADPDLAMVDPARFGPLSAPRLRGLGLPGDLLDTLYSGAFERLMAALPK